MANENSGEAADDKHYHHDSALANYDVGPADKANRCSFPIAIEDTEEFCQRSAALSHLQRAPVLATIPPAPG